MFTLLCTRNKDAYLKVWQPQRTWRRRWATSVERNRLSPPSANPSFVWNSHTSPVTGLQRQKKWFYPQHFFNPLCVTACDPGCDWPEHRQCWPSAPSYSLSWSPAESYWCSPAQHPSRFLGGCPIRVGCTNVLQRGRHSRPPGEVKCGKNSR